MSRAVAGRWSVALVAAAVVGAVLIATPAGSAAGEITVIGGSAVISDEVVGHLRSCTNGTVVRIAGANRYATAAAVSKSVHPAGVSDVFVATGGDFPDAAAAGSPAASTGAPILLTERNTLPEPTRNELARLQPDRIVLLGGDAAVTTGVESELAAYAPVTRVAGADRFATAAAVSRHSDAAWPKPPTVFVATGNNFPDALTGSVAAAALPGPVLLVSRDTIPAPTAAELSRLGPNEIVILGGSAVVSPAVEEALRNDAASVRRVAGANRFGTAAQISRDTFPANSLTAWIATGDDYPDALVGGAAAGHAGGPVLLVTGNTVPAETAAEISRLTGVPCPPFSAKTPTLVRVASGLSKPLYVTSPPADSRLFIVEQGGKVRILANGSLRATPFLDITSKVLTGGERGLLSIAFHPDYASNGRFFVNYSTAGGGGNHIGRVSEFRVSLDPNVASPVENVILDVEQPFSNHNGGQLAFGPDGYLYIGLGDGGAGNDPQDNAQANTTLLGSLLRIDIDSGPPYVSPVDNPYVGTSGRNEIWAIGLRNPWRFSFDGGSLYIGDVGQDAREEIDIVAATAAGLNYGWPQLEGNRCNTGANVVNCSTSGRVAPLVEYSHPLGHSVTGGYVYRGSELPSLVGHYFYGDFSGGWIRSFKLVGGTATEQHDWTPELGIVPGLSSFGRDASGNLYVIGIGGDIYRLGIG